MVDGMAVGSWMLLGNGNGSWKVGCPPLPVMMTGPLPLEPPALVPV